MKITGSAALDLDALQGVLREHPIRLVILFGSYATETTHATSDIDVAVKFNDHRPLDPSYNNVFFELSVELSEALEADNVDLVDLHAVSPQLATTIFEQGILLVGETEHATELDRRLTAYDPDQQSPCERLDAALDRIDDHHSDDDIEISATDNAEDNGRRIASIRF